MIRHSLLPKLAACPCFESKQGEAGPAAQRGTKLDGIFRRALETGIVDDNLSKEDAKAVKWALKQVKKIAGDNPIISNEDMLKVQTPGIEHVGTEDVRIPDINTSCDLKTGQVRPYYEQMCAYSLGNMESHFVDEWTCHLIFCDQQKVVTHKFTKEQAERIIKDILDAYADPTKEPTHCDYCSWCAKKDTCPAIVQPVQEAHSIMVTANLAVLRDEIASDPARLSRFLQLQKVFESELVKPLKDAAKAKLDAGETLEGWRISHVKGSEYFDKVAIVSAAVAGKWGLDDLVEALGGTIKADVFRELCEKYRTQVPEDQLITKEATTRMIEDKPKKLKK